MGYTTGRVLTDDILYQIAKKYRSRSEFQQKDPSAYKTARTRGILNHITKHMKTVGFSVPQLLCRYLLDTLLKEHSLYNTRKIIPPYEIDIYYPKLKLSIEYNGKGWHTTEQTLKRDCIKQQLLLQAGIFSVVIHENSRDYEKDIKTQFASNKEFLEKFNLKATDILNCPINWEYIYNQTTLTERIKNLKSKIHSCSTQKEFRTLFKKDYTFMVRHKLLFLLSSLPKQRYQYSDEQLINIANSFSNYSEFTNSTYYHTCRRKKLLDKISLPRKNKWKDLSNADILLMVEKTKCKYASDLKRSFPELYYEIKRRKFIWKSRKIKNDPMEIWNKMKNLWDCGMTNAAIKKQHTALYSSFQFNKKKGKYSNLQQKGTNVKEKQICYNTRDP